MTHPERSRRLISLALLAVVPLDGEAATEETWREANGLAQEWLSVKLVESENATRDTPP